MYLSCRRQRRFRWTRLSMQGSCHRRAILVVAQHTELRARIARLLRTAGYSVELAESQKRALELAAGRGLEAAIVVDSGDLAGLGRELRDRVPRTIVLEQPTHENPLSAQTLDEQKLLDWLGQPTDSATSAGEETTPSAVIVRIEDCEFHLAGQHLYRWQRPGSATDPRRDGAAGRIRGQPVSGTVA